VNGLAGLAPFVLIAVVFWLLLIRPQRRRQMELMATQRGVEIGDEVLLGAGIVGRVAATEDEYLRLEVDPGVHLKVARQAVVRVLRPEDAAAPDVVPDGTAGEPANDVPEEAPRDALGDPVQHDVQDDTPTPPPAGGSRPDPSGRTGDH
jgi:preprotein translocase subunit YajC